MGILEEEEFPSDVSLLLSNAASGDLSQGIHNVEPIPMFPRPVSRQLKRCPRDE